MAGAPTFQVLTKITDFTGVWELPQTDENESRIEAIIEEVEKDTFKKMFGDDAYLLLKEYEKNPWETGDPFINDDFNDFWLGNAEGYYDTDTNRHMIEGFKKAILSFAWFEIMRDQSQFPTTNGIMYGLAENANSSSHKFDALCRMFNRGVDIYNEANQYIQLFMIDSESYDADFLENWVFTEIEKISWL